MRIEHFDRVQPACPLCWATRREHAPLRPFRVALTEGEDIREGSLVCSERLCQREYPIIDGIPILVTNPASWLEHQGPHLLRRHDLTPFTESSIGDMAGPGSPFDRERGNNGIYAHAHWAPDSPAYLHVFQRAVALLPSPPQGLWIDIGCSVGRGAFELAAATQQLSIGVNLNFSMLRLAEQIRRSGRARYSRRRVGLVFDPVDDPIPDFPAQDVSFWCADVATLPFASGVFQGAVSMNMLDCVASPLAMLLEMGRVLAPAAPALLATPFDWAAGATQSDAWLGGHSQRSGHEGSSLAELRRVLSPGCDAGIDTGLIIEAEADQVKWRLRTHERSVTEYDVYLACLRRKAA